MTDRSESAHPLSPDAGDVAVSSFSLFHGGPPRSQQPGGGAITHVGYRGVDDIPTLNVP